MHGFALAAIAIAASDIAVAMLDDWSRPALLEAAILFDLGLLIPALYWWCHRARGKAAVLRAIGLGCLGIWVAGHVVPDEHHAILGTVGAIRYLGLAILVAIELKLVAHVLRATFGRSPDARASVLATAQDAGLPEWAARLMAWEASLWRKAWDTLRRWTGRD